MLRAHGVSDPGLSRKANEDCFLVDEELGLFVVADGMGGHAAGDVASRLAVEAIEAFVRRSHALRLLTEDDTWVGMLRAQNPAVDPELLARHPMRGVLINVLGAREEAAVHVSEHDLRGGETILLCSDGLHRPVPDDVIAACLRAPGDLPQAARRLVGAALDRGGRDNVTMLLVATGDDA